ncbi:MAG TPA: hypothetical protein VFZ16_06385 [Hyphomicrobiaceae bacterium]|nr:hypothetical protein [Hyphomicrobiaceae bacterium]
MENILRGDAVLNGGTAANLLRGGLGADVLGGKGGTDYADYLASATGLTVSLADPGVNTGEAAGDVFISIEGILGSRFDDVLIGSANTNLLGGGAGFDVLDGGDGIDYAHYQGSSIGLTISLADPGLNTGNAFNDTYISIEGILGTRYDDVLIGDDGDNCLRGTGGGDTLDGGDGGDTAEYLSWRALEGGTASLTDSSGNTGDAAGDS